MKLFFDNEIIEIEEGTSILENFKKKINFQQYETIACRFNNEVKSLNFCPKTDGNLSFIDYKNKDGKRIYLRGLLYIFAKATEEILPGAFLTVNYQLSNAMLCHVDNMSITEEIIERIDSRMKEIIGKDLPIVKKTMSMQEAEEFYRTHHTLKGRLQASVPSNKDISLYYCEDYYDYFYGVMPISTGYIKVYEILKYGDRNID